MKALSIRQPWATLVALGEKTVEHRTWETRYRGQVLICSGKKAIYDDQGLVAPGGLALCTVTLNNIEIFTKYHAESACMDGFMSGYAWIFTNCMPIKPFKVGGKLRLFEVQCNPEPLPGDYEDHIDYILKEGII